MAITDTTAEVSALRKDKELQDAIDSLTDKKAQFIIKSLIAAGHVSGFVIQQAINLAMTIKEY